MSPQRKKKKKGHEVAKNRNLLSTASSAAKKAKVCLNFFTKLEGKFSCEQFQPPRLNL